MTGVEIVGSPLDTSVADAAGGAGRSRYPPHVVVLEALLEAGLAEDSRLRKEGGFFPAGEDARTTRAGRQRNRCFGSSGAEDGAIDEAVMAVEAGTRCVIERSVRGQRKRAVGHIGDKFSRGAALSCCFAVEDIIVEHAKGLDDEVLTVRDAVMVSIR